jgi:hypothetical protein
LSAFPESERAALLNNHCAKAGKRVKPNLSEVTSPRVAIVVARHVLARIGASLKRPHPEPGRLIVHKCGCDPSLA